MEAPRLAGSFISWSALGSRIQLPQPSYGKVAAIGKSGLCHRMNGALVGGFSVSTSAVQ